MAPAKKDKYYLCLRSVNGSGGYKLNYGTNDVADCCGY